jgi:hypothetical protein
MSERGGNGVYETYYELISDAATSHDVLINVNRGDWITFSGNFLRLKSGQENIPEVRNDTYVISVTTILANK